MKPAISHMFVKMTDFYQGNTALVAHFVKVYGYAHTIGILEGLDDKTQFLLEMAAICHDIAIPTCMEKYGTGAGRLQEKESEALLRPFLKEFRLPKETEERIIFLVSHHHTYAFVDGMDWQILLEADFLVNADESRHSRSSIDKMTAQVFRTNTGKHLLSSIYQNVK